MMSAMADASQGYSIPDSIFDHGLVKLIVRLAVVLLYCPSEFCPDQLSLLIIADYYQPGFLSDKLVHDHLDQQNGLILVLPGFRVR